MQVWQDSIDIFSSPLRCESMTDFLFIFIPTTGKYYRYFKGNVYHVPHMAKHSETFEDIVEYQAMYGERSRWVPLTFICKCACNLRNYDSPHYSGNNGYKTSRSRKYCAVKYEIILDSIFLQFYRT